MLDKKIKKKILILNGSPKGSGGNCQILISKIIKNLSDHQVEVCHLSQENYSLKIKAKLKAANGVIFVSGTYWDSWGSPLQKFLEKATELEGSPILLGKPCAVFILMHSVGGKGVLSRLQGVLSTLGFLIPPMSGMVYSSVAQKALKSAKMVGREDIWSLNDILLILANLRVSLEIKKDWISWPVDQKNFRKLWLK